MRFGKSSNGSPPKRRTVFTVPEMDWIVGVFDHYLTEVRPRFEVGGHPALWVTERCGRLSKRGVNEAFETAREAAGLPAELDLHSLRHSMITHLVEFDYPERFVQDQAGHATASSTAIYTGVSDEYRNQLLRRKLAERHREPVGGRPAVIKKMGYRWNLRRLMAGKDMFQTTDLVPLLAERGITLSREQVFRLVTQPPQRLSMDTLAALCDILDCTPNDLIEIEAVNAEVRKTAGARARTTPGGAAHVDPQAQRPVTPPSTAARLAQQAARMDAAMSSAITQLDRRSPRSGRRRPRRRRSRRRCRSPVRGAARFLEELTAHMDTHPDALTSGDSRCPPVLMRLTHVLARRRTPGDPPRLRTLRQDRHRICGSCGPRAGSAAPATRDRGWRPAPAADAPTPASRLAAPTAESVTAATASTRKSSRNARSAGVCDNPVVRLPDGGATLHRLLDTACAPMRFVR